ncbi:MAG: hypothetical protein IPK25_12335 [Saprospiraceae bacterium]|nr:hypothetical protein [Saprospiraceae bacterium]
MDLPLYYNHPDYDNHSSALDNSLAAEQPLKFGQEPIMLGKKDVVGNMVLLIYPEIIIGSDIFIQVFGQTLKNICCSEMF